jgi:hypothetical protein
MLQWAIHVCFKCMFQIFHLFQTYVASVSFGYCKTRSGCCIYMQVFQVFLYVYCKCFILMFPIAAHVFSSFFWCFGRMLQVFQLFWTYVASVLSVCYKSRSDVAHVAMRVRSWGGTSAEWSLRAVWRRGPCMGARNAGSGGGVLTRAREMRAQRGRPSRRPGTSPAVYMSQSHDLSLTFPSHFLECTSVMCFSLSRYRVATTSN